MYDPRQKGANCDECPLRGLPVVPPSGALDSSIAFVAEAPGEVEEDVGEPLVGRSGFLFNSVLSSCGLSRADVWLTNTVLCRPRDKDGKNAPPPKEAISACAARLEAELEGRSVVVPMGAVALHAVAPHEYVSPSGRPRGITSVRGYSQRQGSSRTIVPTVHPAFVLRKPNWFPAFEADIKKAVENNGESFRPETFVARTVADVTRFFEHTENQPVVLDTETSRDHPMRARLKCIGLSCRCDSCVTSMCPKNLTIPFEDHNWQPGVKDEVLRILREQLSGKNEVDNRSSVRDSRVSTPTVGGAL